MVNIFCIKVMKKTLKITIKYFTFNEVIISLRIQSMTNKITVTIKYENDGMPDLIKEATYTQIIKNQSDEENKNRLDVEEAFLSLNMNYYQKLYDSNNDNYQSLDHENRKIILKQIKAMSEYLIQLQKQINILD